MRKRRKVLVILGLIALAAVCFVILKPLDEPKYQGRYLSEWLEVLAAGRLAKSVGGTLTIPARTREYDTAQLAVRSIGTNALPHYLKWMRYERPAWRINFETSLQNKLPLWVLRNRTIGRWIVGSADRQATYASLGIEVLGTNAVSAVPELKSMIRDRASPITAVTAIYALRSVGQAAIPTLDVSLADTNQLHRDQIVWALRFLADDGHARACLPLVRAALDDKDAVVRKAATNALIGLGPNTMNAEHGM